MAIDATVTDIVQEINDARVDMQSFASFMFEPASVMITRRLAPDTHSLQHYLDYLDAIKLVFTQESGDVTVGDRTIKTVQQSIGDAVDIIVKAGGHVGYATLAAATADKANIAAKTVVEITNDTTANNGIYLYNGTTFTKSSYNPIAQAVADSKIYTDAEIVKAVNKSSGTFDTLSLLNASTLVNNSYALVANDTDANNGYYQKKAGVWVRTTFDVQKLIAEKADKELTVKYTDFQLGKINYGNRIEESAKEAYSPAYKFPVGTVINLSRKNNLSGFGISGAESDRLQFPSWLGEYKYVYTVTAEKPYIRFFIRVDKGLTTLDIAESLLNISITTESTVVYEADLNARLAAFTPPTPTVVTRPSNTLYHSNYRTPSRAVGGMISIIDDDGRAATFSGLHQTLKSLDAPYGLAVSPGNLGKEGYLTEDQLRLMSQDFKTTEIMNHSWTHNNLSNLDAEAIRANMEQSSQWFIDNGYPVKGFILPNGGSNATVSRIVQEYYPATYHYVGTTWIETFAKIKNTYIKRHSFNGADIATFKAKIDEAIALNGWLIICTHSGHPSTGYWDVEYLPNLTEVINYARLKNVPIVKPSEGFQTFGNISENDIGWSLAANGIEYVNGVPKV